MRFFAVIFLVMLSACAPRHDILGTGYGWNADKHEIEIVFEDEINKLKVRHVRVSRQDCVSGFLDHLEIAGEIGPDSTAAIKKLLESLPQCEDPDGGWLANVVFLSASGGRLSDGYALGRLFRKHQVQTMITGGQECVSSCAIAFLGGYFRVMDYDSRLLFHSPYLKDGTVIDCEDSTQVAALEAYYKEVLGNATGEALLDRTMHYCSLSPGWTLSSKATLDVDGAKRFGITTH